VFVYESPSLSFSELPSLSKHAGVALELDPRVVHYGRAAAVVDLYGGSRDAYMSPSAWTPPRGQRPPVKNYTGIRAATKEEALLHRDHYQRMTYGCSVSNYP
jgi:hypothetical protein